MKTRHILMGLATVRVFTAFALFGSLPRNPAKAQVGDLVIGYAVISVLLGFAAWLMCPPACEDCKANRCPAHKEKPTGGGDVSES